MRSFMKKNIFKIVLVLFLGISFAQSRDFQVWVPDESENPAMSAVVDVALSGDGTLYVLLPCNVKHLDSNGSLIGEWGSCGDADGEFASAGGIAVGGDGSVYLSDTLTCTIQKFDGDGNFIKKWGVQGDGDGQFNSPAGIAIDAEGKIFVVDSGNDRIQKFDSDGNFIKKWGVHGDGDGQFDSPYGIDIDSDGYLFVSDVNNNRIQKFDSDGAFVLKWGSVGRDDGEFIFLRNLAVDGDGNVYVADSGNDRIQKFDSDGNFRRRWGSHGYDEGLFDDPTGIAIDREERVYAVDTFNCRVEKFDIDGTFLLKWGECGLGDGEFTEPYAVATDTQGDIYVSDRGKNIVQKFDNEGNFLLKWGSTGNSEGEFDRVSGIAVDGNDSIYVADFSNNRIQKFDSDGNFILQWGTQGSGDGEFDGPKGVAIDSDGYVYVTDSVNCRVQKFDSDGNFIMKWGSEGSGDGEFINPGFITVDKENNIWVADSESGRVQEFDKNGNFIEAWKEKGAANGQFEFPAGLVADSENTIYLVDRGNNRIQRMPMPPVEATVTLKNVNLSEHNISAIRIVEAAGENEIAKFDNIENGDNNFHYKVKSGTPVYIEAIVSNNAESKSWYYDFKHNAFVNERDGGISFYKRVDFDNDTMEADAGVWMEREYDYPPQLHIVEGGFDAIGWIEILQPSQLAIDSARNILFTSFYDVENDNSGIEVLDFSDPANISRISSIEESQNGVRDMLLSSCGKRLYVTRESGFYIYDVNNTSSISEIGRAFDSDYDLYEMAYDPRKSIVYILGNPSSDSTEQHIYVMDVSDPSSITKLSTIDLNTSNYYEHIYFDSDTLYVMSESVEASTYDVSDPSSPRELDFHPALSEMVVSEDGDYFYGVGIVDGYGMREIGVMRADTLEWEDSMELGDANHLSMSVDADEKFMYVDDGNGLIMKISLEDRANIHVEDYIHIHSQNENIDMPLNESGEYIFTPEPSGNRVSAHIVRESQLFHSDIESAVDGFYELDRFRLDRSDDYLYFAGLSDDWENGSIARVELSDASVERVIDVDFGDFSMLTAFSVIDDETFAVTSESCMMGFIDETGDVVDKLFSCPEEGKLTALTSSAATMLAYYAYEDPNGNEYIGVFNESEELSLVQIGAEESFDSVNALYVDEARSILYAGSGERLYVIELSNPYHPVVLADIALENIADIDMAPSDDILYILSSNAVGGSGDSMGATSTISIVDVSDPSNPSKVDEYSVPEENERRVEGSPDPYRLFSGGYKNLFISDPTPSHSIPDYKINYYRNSDFLFLRDKWKIAMVQTREDANGASYRLRYFDAVPRLYLAQGFGNYTISLHLWDREHETLTVNTKSSDESIFSVASGDGEYDAATYESGDINITIEEGDSTGLSRLDIELSDENGKMVRSALDIVVYSILEPSLPPAAPSDFEATEINSTSVTLEWKDNADDEKGFNLYRSEEGGDFVELNNTIEADSESYVDNTVEPGKSYRYKLVSDKDCLESDPVYTDVQTPEELPAAPTDLSADRVEAYRVELSWVDNADNEDGFNLYRSENGGEFVEINNTIEADTQSYIDETVQPDTNYTYRIVADNSAGESNASEVSVSTPDIPPKAPENFRATSVSSHSVTLEWSDTDREKGYRIYRDGSVVSGDLPADSTSFTDDSVEENTTYKYVLKAFNDAGESDAVEITLNTPNEKPLAPSDLSADARSESVTLHWKDNADNEDGFRIYRDEILIDSSTPANVTSFVDNDVQEGRSYNYCVSAYNNGGESSGLCIDVSIPISIPAAPSKMSAKAYADGVMLTWQDNADNEKGFRLYRDGKLLQTLAADSVEYLDTTTQENRHYIYELEAFNDGGESQRVKTEITTPLRISVLFSGVDHALRDIVDVAVVSKDGEVIALFHPQDGDSMESLYIVEGTEFFVKVDAKVDGGSTRSWYLNFSDSKLYKNGNGGAFLKRADISDRELRVDLGIESWPVNRPELLKVPSDQVLSDAGEPVTLDIGISQSNYAALMMKVKVEPLPTLTYETNWDEESWLTVDEYEGRVFKLTLIPDRAQSNIVTITLTDRYGNETSNSFRVTVNQSVTITAEPSEGDAPLEVNLSAVSAEEFGRVKRVIWDFGDGERDEKSGANVVHIFEKPGTYGVRVNIFNENGAHAEDRREIIVKNGNFVYHLKKGKNEISLPTRMHLDEDGLQAIFGSDAIDYLAKQSGFGWSYWDREKKPNPKRLMSRFSSLDSTEGFILYAKKDFDLVLPIKRDQIEGRDDFAKLYGPGWYFVGVNSNKSMKEIEALVAKQGMKLEIVEYMEQNGRIYFYTPDSKMDSRINPSIPRLDHVEREWGFYVKVK